MGKKDYVGFARLGGEAFRRGLRGYLASETPNVPSLCYLAQILAAVLLGSMKLGDSTRWLRGTRKMKLM